MKDALIFIGWLTMLALIMGFIYVAADSCDEDDFSDDDRDFEHK